jgi:hypothetical protein
MWIFQLRPDLLRPPTGIPVSHRQLRALPYPKQIHILMIKAYNLALKCGFFSYGQIYPDRLLESLYHIANCGPSHAFAFDFEFASSGFKRDLDCPPMLQLAFQYTRLTPTKGDISLLKMTKNCFR